MEHTPAEQYEIVTKQANNETVNTERPILSRITQKADYKYKRI